MREIKREIILNEIVPVFYYIYIKESNIKSIHLLLFLILSCFVIIINIHGNFDIKINTVFPCPNCCIPASSSEEVPRDSKFVLAKCTNLECMLVVSAFQEKLLLVLHTTNGFTIIKIKISTIGLNQ